MKVLCYRALSLLIILYFLISCNKKIIYNNDKSCYFVKKDFYIGGEGLKLRSFSPAPLFFYKFIDSLYPNQITNLCLEPDGYLSKIGKLGLPKKLFLINGCIDSIWIAKILRTEYEKKYGVYLKDTTLAINIYDAKVIDTSKLDILPLIDYTKSNMDSILKNVKSLAAVGGNYIEDETLPGNKIHYLVSRDTIGQYFEVFNAPQTLLLFSIRNQTGIKHRLAGVVDYQIKEDVLQPGQTRLNLHYKLHNDIFEERGFEGFKKYCLEHHGVEVWLDRVDTFKVKKIKFRN